MFVFPAPEKCIFFILVIAILILQAHIVHYNRSLYPSFSAAAKAKSELSVLGIFIQVCSSFCDVVESRRETTTVYIYFAH